MTKQEKIIVSAYTGVLMCDFVDLQEYIEKKFGRPVFTHEMADKGIQKEVKEKSKEDFLEICKQEEDPEWLTDDDFETIRMHLNAYKEKLCNQRRWKEAEEYQRIIDRFMAFASAQPERPEQPESAKEYCAECNHIEMCRWYPYEGCEFRSLPSAQPEPHWIPCSERMPKEKDAGILKKLGTKKKSEYVLATVEVKGERMTVTACTYDGKWDWNMKYAFPDFKVVAWMSMPKPARCESDE